jgi:hypothetical protein
MACAKKRGVYVGDRSDFDTIFARVSGKAKAPRRF